jgi:hypothetical protein
LILDFGIWIADPLGRTDPVRHPDAPRVAIAWNGPGTAADRDHTFDAQSKIGNRIGGPRVNPKSQIQNPKSKIAGPP